MKCPTCNKGQLKQGMKKKLMFGVELGTFPAELCSHCEEAYYDEETMEKIEEVAKEKGIWGLGKQTKITRTGNSLAVRIPKKLADYLGLKEGQEAYIHPEGDKLILEH